MRQKSFVFTLALLVLAMLSPLHADQLQLKDGRQLLGKVVSESVGSLTFAFKAGDRTIVERFQRSQIDKIIRELDPANDPFAGDEEEVTTDNTNAPKEIRVDTKRIVFLFDTSGSMGIGDRLVRAKILAKKLISGYSAETRLQIYTFDESVQPLLRNFQNVINANEKSFQTALGRVSVNYRGKTNFEKAVKQTLRSKPDEIHLFSDGISRVAAGATLKQLRSRLIKVLDGDIKCHVHLFQQGKIGWLGNEPLQKSRVLFEDLAKITGGDFSVEPKTAAKRNNEMKLELEVLLAGRKVENLEIGKKYYIRLKITDRKNIITIPEYITSLPVLARSVDPQGKDVFRRINIPVTSGKFGLTSQFQVKVIGANSSYAGAPGYIGAVAGGKVALFFDAMGRWVTHEVPVTK